MSNSSKKNCGNPKWTAVNTNEIKRTFAFRLYMNMYFRMKCQIYLSIANTIFSKLWSGNRYSSIVSVSLSLCYSLKIYCFATKCISNPWFFQDTKFSSFNDIWNFPLLAYLGTFDEDTLSIIYCVSLKIHHPLYIKIF